MEKVCRRKKEGCGRMLVGNFLYWVLSVFMETVDLYEVFLLGVFYCFGG